MRGSNNNPRQRGRGGRQTRQNRGSQRGRGQTYQQQQQQPVSQRSTTQQQQHQPIHDRQNNDRILRQTTVGAQINAPNPYAGEGPGQQPLQQPYSYPGPFSLSGEAHTTYASSQPIRTAYASVQPTEQSAWSRFNNYHNNEPLSHNTNPSHAADFERYGDSQTEVAACNSYSYQEYSTPQIQNVPQHLQALNISGTYYQTPSAALNNHPQIAPVLHYDQNDLYDPANYHHPNNIYANEDVSAATEISAAEPALLAPDPSNSRPPISETPTALLRSQTALSSESALTRPLRHYSPVYETVDDFLAANNMMPSQQPHMYAHQQGSGHFHNDPNWMQHHPQQQGGHHIGAQQQQQGGHPAHMNHLGHTGHPHAGGAQQQGPYPRSVGGSGGGSHGPQAPHQGGSDSHIPGIEVLTDEHRRLLQWVHDLLENKDNKREPALMELSKKREQVPELALILWHTFGVMAVLTNEILTVYPLLNPSQLTAAASNRVCNALALLQCVASHNETRQLFLNAHLPLFLYPFLNTTSKSRPFEYLRLTSLGVIGALVKNDSTEVINFLLTTEIIPLCLRIMETGSELSKTVAIFIVQKILLDDLGLGYICHTYERFYAVGTVLSNMVQQLVEQQTVRLLKHVVRCFLRLSDNARAREALRQCLPEPLRDATFSPILRDDAATKRCLAQLLINLSDNIDNGPPPGQQNPNMQ